MLALFRIYAKHAAVLFAVGLLLQLVALHSRGQDQPTRPRITGIDHIRLYVTDIDKSREFYSKLPGVRLRGGRCFDDAGSCFTVGWGGWNRRIDLEKAPALETKNWLAEIAFATDNVEQMRNYLFLRGISASKISKDLSPPNNDAHFEVLDPEGNPISFIQRFGIADDPPRSTPYHVRLLHAGFVVKDMAAENRFYVDVLGFKLYWYGGFKDDGVDWYELQVPDGDNWIEYMLNVPVNADHKQLGAQNHFSFGVNTIQAAVEQLRKNGLEKIAGPGIGRDGKRGLNVYDPDDTRVEITEFTPAREPCCHPYTAAHPTP
jgi:catechol 2,3-dioxygenase-like lactoylglutathione lyase family enzyme